MASFVNIVLSMLLSIYDWGTQGSCLELTSIRRKGPRGTYRPGSVGVVLKKVLILKIERL